MDILAPTHCLVACAVIAYLRQEPGAEVLKAIIEHSNTFLAMHACNLGEVYYDEGRSVTLPGFGGFYIRPQREAWAFKFNPGQKLRALFGWSSSYKGKLWFPGGWHDGTRETRRRSRASYRDGNHR